MIDTAFERHLASEARELAAGGDPIKLLCAMLRDAGVRVTFDLGASIVRPCTVCGAPGPHELVLIGTYLDGSPLRRPVCEQHRLVMHLHGAEPDNQQLQALAAYEAARPPHSRRAPTPERLREELGRRLRGAPAVVPGSLDSQRSVAAAARIEGMSTTRPLDPFAPNEPLCSAAPVGGPAAAPPPAPEG